MSTSIPEVVNDWEIAVICHYRITARFITCDKIKIVYVNS